MVAPMPFLRILLRAAPIVVAGLAAGWWVSRRIGAPEHPQLPAPKGTGRFERSRPAANIVDIVDDLLAVR
jgi:hypothetical protein